MLNCDYNQTAMLLAKLPARHTESGNRESMNAIESEWNATGGAAEEGSEFEITALTPAQALPDCWGTRGRSQDRSSGPAPVLRLHHRSAASLRTRRPSWHREDSCSPVHLFRCTRG